MRAENGNNMRVSTSNEYHMIRDGGTERPQQLMPLIRKVEVQALSPDEEMIILSTRLVGSDGPDYESTTSVLLSS